MGKGESVSDGDQRVAAVDAAALTRRVRCIERYLRSWRPPKLEAEP